MKQFAMDAAKEVRLLSDCKVRVGAVLERGGRILAVSSNKSGSMKHGGYLYSRHAESSLLTNRNAQGATVYVYREHGLWNRPLLAKPCKRCELRLTEANLKRVYYSAPNERGWDVLYLR